MRSPLRSVMITLLVIVGSILVPAGASGAVVITSFFAHSGAAGSAWSNDFVVLHNTGQTGQSVSGWSLQYAATAGNFNGGASLATLSAVTIPAGGFYLITGTAGGGTTAVTGADATSSINLAQGGGKLALVNTATALGPCPACLSDASVVDFVGYGTAAEFEGTASATTPTSAAYADRRVSSCQDSDQNAADFTTAAIGPRSSSTTAALCPQVDTIRTAGLTDGTITNNASITLSYIEAAGYRSAYECQLDSGAWTACGGPSNSIETYNAILADGAYTLRVRAVVGGQTDATPLSAGFTIDTVAPVPTATGSYDYIGGAFNYVVTRETATDAVECRFDTDAWAACALSGSVTSLADGAHSFEYRSTDAAGNMGIVQTISFTAAAPGAIAMTTAPSGAVAPGQQTFAWSADKPGPYAFMCSLDGAAPIACDSPLSIAVTTDGTHTFTVSHTPNPRVLTQATAQFQIASIPETTISSPASSTAPRNTVPAIVFSASIATARFECSLDGAAWATCTSPHTATVPSDGEHQVRVRAVSSVGALVDASPASVSFVLDRAAPFVFGTTSVARDGTFSWQLTASEPDVSFRCALDGRTIDPCPVTGSANVGAGSASHAFEAHGIDVAGNVSSIPVLSSFTVNDLADVQKELVVRTVATPTPLRTRGLAARGYLRSVVCASRCRASTLLYVPRASAKRLGLANPRNARYVRVGFRSAARTRAGALAMRVKLTPAALRAFGRVRSARVLERVTVIGAGTRETRTRSMVIRS